MASAGFVADFAKKPPQYKAIVFGGIALVLGFMYFKFGYSPLKEKLVQARQDNEEMLNRTQRMDDDMKKFKELRTRMEQLQKIIDDNQKALPSESELPAFFETLNRKVTEAGVEVRKWNRKKEENLGQFIKVPVDVEITGTFFQIKRFMASLVQRDVQLSGAAAAGTESRERVVSIEDLSLTDPTVKNREIVMVAKFVASTYRQEDKTAAGAKPGAAAAGAPAAAGSAAGAKPAAGAGSAAGSGAGSAPANSGMITSQPAQVKANVNESINKGDARNRAGTGPETATPAVPATPTPAPAPSGAGGKGGN